MSSSLDPEPGDQQHPPLGGQPRAEGTGAGPGGHRQAGGDGGPVAAASAHLRGGVVRGRSDRQFREFAEKLDAPVAITVMGGGGFPGAHPLTTGMIGMHGSQASNVACNECDLLIAVGCRFSDRVALQPETFASQAKIVHIDIDRSEIDKNVLTDHHIIGSAKRVLELLNERLPQYHHQAWKERILPLREGPGGGGGGQADPRPNSGRH